MGRDIRLQIGTLTQVSVLVDTSTWSLALRRDGQAANPQVAALTQFLQSGESILTTGIVLQELLQGFGGPEARKEILERFSALPLLVPDRQDHVAAAALRNTCRRKGVQVGTIDALLAQLCLHHDLLLLTNDNDFQHVAKHCALRLWTR